MSDTNSDIQKFVSAMISLEGSPFRHAGRNPETGLDCAGTLILSLNRSGLSDWDDSGYSRIINPERLRKDVELFCDKVEDSTMQIGDVLIFNIKGNPQHLGVIVDYNEDNQQFWFTHAMEREEKGGVIRERLDMRWLTRIDSVYRWKGIN